MSTDGYVYAGQEFILSLNTGVDLSDDDGNVELRIQRPDGEIVTVTPTIDTPATSGVVSYTFAAGELSQAGEWVCRVWLNGQDTPGRAFYLSVLAPWVKEGIPTVQEIREFLSDCMIPKGIVSDEWIAARRDAFVIPWMESKLRRPIMGIKELEEYYDGTGSSILVLRSRPITELISITPTGIEPQAGMGITPVALEVIKDEGVLKAKTDPRGGNWTPVFWRGKRNLRVRYKVGTLDAPPELREVIILLCSDVILSRAANITGGGDVSVQSYSRNFGQGGKWSSYRNELVRSAHAIMRLHMTGVGG